MATDYKLVRPRYTPTMHRDALERRNRFAEPQPVANSIDIHAGDDAVFDGARRHGPLPSPYLFEFAKPHTTSWQAFQCRLTLLYNGSLTGPQWLARPPEQFRSFKARYQHLIYDLSKAAKALMLQKGRRLIIRTDHFVHQFMNACVGASFEIAGRGLGLTYIHVDDILARLCSSLEIQNGDGRLIPDALFGLRYLNGSYRFFWVEVDRNTESMESTTHKKKTWTKTFEVILDLLEARTYKDHWGVPTLLILIITTNETHKRNLIALLDKITNSKHKERFLFKTKQEFGINWTIPPIMYDLLTEPWTRTGTPFDISKP